MSPEKKYTAQQSEKQLSLFDKRPTIEHPEISEQVRRQTYEGIEYLSLVDIMAQMAETGRFRQYWRETKNRLKKDKFQLYDEIVQLKMIAKDGKERLTDCAPLDVCMRIVQSVPGEEAEKVRMWLASLGAREIDEAQHPEKAVARRIHELQKYERAGYGNATEIRRLRERHEGIDSLKQLKDLIAKVCDNPNYAQIMNAEYLAMFGEIASELKRILNTNSIRDALPPLQLQYLKTAEYGLLELIKQANLMDMEQILQTIDLIVKPLGEHLKQVSDMLGVHHITGQKLLTDGQS